jgi:SAM-dependent methyltransferase
MPQNIYDNPEFFAGYSQFQRSREGLPGAPEWPTMRSMLPPMQSLRVLDLGCGFGAFARWAAEMGAQNVLGIDLSQKMLERARELTQSPRVTYRRGDISNLESNQELSLELRNASFDLVYSALALHYITDFGAICALVRRLLVPGGHFVFSVEHPLFTAPSNPEWLTSENGDKFWPLNDYLREGERVRNWVTSGVLKQHRTIATYVNGLLEHGFQLTRLVEWGPNQEQLERWPDLVDELNRPTFMLVGAQLHPV